MGLHTIKVHYAIIDGDGIKMATERGFVVEANTLHRAEQKIVSMFAGKPQYTFKIIDKYSLKPFNDNTDIFALSGKALG
jgi:hypothetical protein